MGRDWATSYSDAELLDMLWRRACGQTAAQIALTVGATRAAICGQFHRIDRALEIHDPARLDDAQMLTVLDDLHGRGLAASAIGKRIGWPRAAVLGLVHAVRLDLARSNGPADAPRAVRPGNRNGDLPLGWWTKGIWNRPEVA